MGTTYQHSVELDHPKGKVTVTIASEKPELVSHVANSIRKHSSLAPLTKLEEIFQRFSSGFKR